MTEKGIIFKNSGEMVNESNMETNYYSHNESLLNECLRQIFSTTDPGESARRLLAYIGKTFSCDRVYIFEMDNDTVNNTYEWCADGVDPQIDILQRVPISVIDWWLQLFYNGQVTIITDLEDIRRQYPEAYAILKPQNVMSLAAGPIRDDNQIIGFIGVDNPNLKMMNLLTSLLNVLGYFTSTLLKQRNLLSQLQSLSYHDSLTGALNRNALAEYYGKLDLDCMGVIYCDITGLKWINDFIGHEAGDRMIIHCYQIICKAVKTELVYRIGGDEFLVLFPNCSKEAFYESVSQLKKAITENEYHMAVGYIWSDQKPIDLDDLMHQADQIMYHDKREYYRLNGNRLGVDRRRREDNPPQDAELQMSDNSDTVIKTLFQKFLSKAHCDMETVFQSVSQDNGSSYFYMGDMQRGLFYVSDNMREDFGFHSNLVPQFLAAWSKRISTPEFRKMFQEDISKMYREKRSVHDMRYRVRDVHGNNQWIRCYGILKWNKDYSEPLFFSGRITHQDMEFVVDPITSFPREHVAIQRLQDMQKNGKRALVIGFSLNGLTEINNIKGRAFGDRLLNCFANALLEKLYQKMSFYRLDGVRFMALVNSEYMDEGPKVLIDQIENIANECANSMAIPRQKICSFAVIEYPQADLPAEKIVENLISLIRVAKQDRRQRFLEYSYENIALIHRMADMTLTLSRDMKDHMNHFRVVVQPVVAADTGRIIGGEVLLRWKFEGRDVFQDSLISILEKEKMICQVGRWVFEQTVCTCVRLRSYIPDFYLSFNVSLQQLYDQKLLSFMEQTLKKYQLPGNAVVAELTESSVNEQPEKLKDFIEGCQNLGIRIALDDFGTGYSSMRMLLQYPFSIVKLDRSLVMEATGSKANMNFINSIVFSCRQFGKCVCVEGVEKENENDFILNIGCDMIQGFYYYKPMEISDFYRLISKLTLEQEH